MRLLLQVLVPLACCVGGSAGEKLMLIVLGGFRWDYFNIHTFESDGFTTLFEAGVKAEYLTPSFPTLSPSNLYTITTGLYPENHGVVGDEMWDPEMKKVFRKGDNSEKLKPYWWDGGEPIWITATQQGSKSYLFNWPECETTIRGHRPTACFPYTDVTPDITPDLNKFVQFKREGLEVLKNESADFVGIYMDVSEYVTQLYSPNSPESKGVSRWLDNEMRNLLHEINSMDLEYDVNVLVVSDHGLTDISKKKVVNISSIVQGGDVERVLGSGGVVSVWPREDKIQEVYDQLKDLDSNMAAYLKNDLPARWHFADNIRVPPITLVANMGWYIVTPDAGFPVGTKGKKLKSYHGYDNNEVRMRGIFFGFGPNLKRGYNLPGIENVNIYQLMCRILRVSAAPNNGTWSLVQDAFISIPYRPLITWKKTFTYGPVAALLLVGAIVYYIRFRKPVDKSKEV